LSLRLGEVFDALAAGLARAVRRWR